MIRSGFLLMAMTLFLICFRSDTGWLLFVQAAGLSVKTQEKAASESELRPGGAINGTLGIGQSKRHPVYALSQQFIQLTVTNIEADFELAIFSPTGSKLIACRNRELGRTPVSFISREEGIYQVEIRLRAEIDGQLPYQIRLEDVRAANPSDQLKLTAQQTVNDGERLFRQGNYRQSVEKFEEAVRLWQEAGNRREKAYALVRAGFAHLFLDEYQQLLKQCEEALPIWEALGEPVGIAETLYVIGNADFETGNFQAGLDRHNLALSLWQTAGYLSGQAKCLVTLGLAQGQMGNHQLALKLHSQAWELHHRLGNKLGEASSLNVLGQIHLDLGFYKNAADTFARSLKLAEEVGTRDMQKQILGLLGESLLLQGQPRQALEYFNKELSLIDGRGELRFKAYTLKRLGLAQSALGESAKALDYYNQSLALHREVGNRLQVVAVLNLIGALYERSDNRQEALSYYLQALPLSRLVAYRSEEISILSNIARVQRNLGNLSQARANAENAIRLIESIRQQAGGRQLRASYFATVQQSYSIYVDLLMRQHKLEPSAGLDALALQASERYRARSMVDSLAEARAEIRKGISPDLLKRERELQRLLNFKAERQMIMLGSSGKKEDMDAIARELRALEIEYEQLQEQIRESAPGYAALTQPQPVTCQEIQKHLLDDQTLLLIYSMGDERSYLWAVTASELHSYELPPRAVIEAKAREVYNLMTARQRLDRKNFEQFQRQVRQADEQYWPQAEALSQAILGPAAAKLGNKRLLIVSEGALQFLPFGALPEPGLKKQSGARPAVAAAASPAAHQPLLVNHEIVYLPSVSVLAAVRRDLAEREAASKPSKILAVLADPIFTRKDSRLTVSSNGTAVQPADDLDRALKELRASNAEGTLERLKGAADEAADIASFAEPDSRLTAMGAAANLELVKGTELGQYRFIHFATHGLLNDEHPELSGLVFSLFDSKGAGQEGFLRMHEIYNLKLAAEMVVLSSCEGSIGKEVRGEGLMALTRGFFYAGASRVTASLWKADDAATPVLMRGFYRNLLKEKRPPADALRKAQIAMWDRSQWQAPYFWAGFVLQGEYK